MKCPDCGGDVVRISVSGFDDSLRCERCGGVGMAAWVVNKIAAIPEEQLKISPVGSGVDMSSGTGVCPRDGKPLLAVPAADVPADTQCRVCGDCGWWWISQNDIFAFRQGYLLKKQYTAKWVRGGLQMALPAFVVVLMLVGLGVGVYVVRNRLQTVTQAAPEVSEYGAVYLGRGQEVITFKSNVEIKQIEYRLKGNTEWIKLFAILKTDSVYTVKMWDLKPGTYEVRILDKVFEFEVK